jgi:uncharacterized protein (DUF433 family)
MEKNGQAPRAKKKVVLSRYIVADPKVCGGQLTFRGTRVLVADVLEQVAAGTPRDAIRESWNNEIHWDAIGEALRLAREALLTYWLPPDAAAPLDEFLAKETDSGDLYWWQRMKTSRKLELGRHVVADPKICHGKLTFRGTRIFVADILDQVADGSDFKFVAEDWGGRVSVEAVAEAVRLARESLLAHWPDMEIKDAKPDARAG